MANSKLIAIAALDDLGVDGKVSGHFGRCPHYVLVEVVDGARGRVEVIDNPYFEAHLPGVIPPFLHQLGANVILAGGMGPRAIGLFQDFGMEVVTGVVGDIGNVLDAYLRSDVTGIVPCAHDHPDSCGQHARGDGTGPGGCHG